MTKQQLKKLSYISEGLDCQAQMIDWINTLQFAIKAAIDDASLPESTRLSRAKTMAEISVHLANEARDSVWDYAEDLTTLAVGGGNE